MKIGVVGCGALGSFYGARLCRSGEEVHLLPRSDYDVVRLAGVEIRSVDGDFRARPAVARRPEEIGACDLVLVALKTTANECLARLVPPLADPGTLVLTLQNGLGNEELLAAVVGAERVLGGLCFVCLNRVAPGVIVHSAHGNVVVGEYRKTGGERLRKVQAVFERAGIACRLTDDLERAHWEKLIWNVPFNGLGVAGVAGYESVCAGRLIGDGEGDCLPTDRLLAEPRWEALVRELMNEVIRAAGALGFDLEPALAGKNIERTRVMGAYKASTLLDYEKGMRIELDSLFGEPLRRARSVGVETPRLAGLCSLLEALQARRSVGERH
jgi:2-dehydropantoate 2-reductase